MSHLRVMLLSEDVEQLKQRDQQADPREVAERSAESAWADDVQIAAEGDDDELDVDSSDSEHGDEHGGELGFHTASHALKDDDDSIQRDVLPSQLTRLFSTAKTALRINFIPAIVLNGFALLLLILYFTAAPFQAAFATIADAKEALGVVFSMISTAIAAGIVPSILAIIQQNRADNKLRSLGQTAPLRVPNIYLESLFLTVFWGYRGIEVDLFYRLQALMFGSSGGAGEVVCKVIMDMFVYNPVWATPMVLVGYFWKDADFTVKPAYDKFMSRDYWTFILPSALITVWAIWIPAVSIIYCMPSPLQVPLMAVICCFWSILLQFVTKAESSNIEQLPVDSSPSSIRSTEDSEDSENSEELEASLAPDDGENPSDQEHEHEHE